ncbi:NADH:ubiquinone oxidoreductase 11.5kD subunit [Paraphaeosphaeria sporulosa]
MRSSSTSGLAKLPPDRETPHLHRDHGFWIRIGRRYVHPYTPIAPGGEREAAARTVAAAMEGDDEDATDDAYADNSTNSDDEASKHYNMQCSVQTTRYTTINAPRNGPATRHSAYPRPSRCFPFWQEVLACYVTNTSPESDAGKIKCQPVLEDYYECLHHKKEAARTLALQAAYRKAEANIKRDDAPSAGEIRRLGVLDAPLEEKNLKPSKWFPHREIN